MAERGSRRNDPGGFSVQSSVSSRQDLVQWENGSIETCTLMSWLGYGPEIIQARRDAYMEWGRLMTARACGAATVILTGSKAEGLTRFLESDRDIMFVHSSAMCIEDGVNADNSPREITVFRSYSRMSYPGHCILLLERRGTIIDSELNDALCDNGYGQELISSDLYVHSFSKFQFEESIVQHDRAGPSRPVTLHGGLHSDLVHAFRYNCPNILSQWASRPRYWPLPKVVQQVVSLGAFLSPVGFKGSEYQHVEWRVCFNTAEIELVNNLNDTQIKVYVLLKMVKRDVLNPLKKEISSYTLKNIVLWIAENNPQSSFHERSMLHWLHEGLDALRVALVTRELPYYMIPNRNLMAACGLEEEQQRTWIATLTEMMDEGPRMILRLPKIRQVLIAHPEPFRWYTRRRTEIELLRLMIMNRMALCMDENGEVDETHVTLQTLHNRENMILREFYLRMSMEGSRVNNLNDVLEGMLM
ncbi:uncharacterized protein LOC127868115 [Dreissena polymorpha]|uniref:uncharacterized protein LOC127868115 n=1 Tax=Dreissena polymorpha TaxID=45954 RepID=UPI0022645F80|nr:uncharacterized protein LOC127868115 [Dreissena polymorpha]